jgi:protein-S-isoprenylcysteine O-methyltransferase Ste14
MLELTMTVAEISDPIARSVFFGVMICWCLFALTFLLRKRPAKATETRRDWMAMAGLLVQAGGYALVWFHRFRRNPVGPLFPMSRAAELAVAALTLAIAVASLWMVNAAVRFLGKQWAVAARLVEGHKLVTDGPYRLVRNPIYTGMFGMMVATGLAVTQWQGLLAAIFVFLLGTYLRVRVEERLLREQFGSEFEEYKRRVPAVIPGIW